MWRCTGLHFAVDAVATGWQFFVCTVPARTVDHSDALYGIGICCDAHCCSKVFHVVVDFDILLFIALMQRFL